MNRSLGEVVEVKSRPMEISTSIEQEERMLFTAEAAAICRLSPRTLERLRVEGSGPRYFKLGPGKRARVMYKASDVLAWIERYRYSSTSEYGS